MSAARKTTKKKKKPTRKTTAARSTRKKTPPPETFDFCDGILDDAGEVAQFSDKEKLFVLNYLTDAKFCQAKAARLAGYEAKTENAFRVIGCQMMKKSKIRSAINNALESLTMPKFENLYRLAEIAKNTIDDVIGDDGGLDLEKAKENGAVHNINSIEITERIVDVEIEAVEVPDDLNLPADERPVKEKIERNVIERKTKVKMYNKLTALKVLTDVNFAKKHELTGAGGADLVPAAQVAFYLPSNGRGDSPAELEERAKSPADTKKTS